VGSGSSGEWSPCCGFGGWPVLVSDPPGRDLGRFPTLRQDLSKGSMGLRHLWVHPVAYGWLPGPWAIDFSFRYPTPVRASAGLRGDGGSRCGIGLFGSMDRLPGSLDGSNFQSPAKRRRVARFPRRGSVSRSFLGGRKRRRAGWLRRRGRLWAPVYRENSRQRVGLPPSFPIDVAVCPRTPQNTSSVR